MKKKQHKLITRSAPVEPSSFSAKDNSVDVVATTEAPVRVFDWELYDYVDEILLMDGVAIPAKGTVPLLDSHSRWSVGDILGTAGAFKTEDLPEGVKGLTSKVTYSETEEGKSAATKTQEGHLTDFSVGYKVVDSILIPDGEKYAVNGTLYEGPKRIVTQWELKELSATPIGADVYAKARSDYHAGAEPTSPAPKGERREPMDPKAKKKKTETDEKGISLEEAGKMAEKAANEAAERTLADERARVAAENERREAITGLCNQFNLACAEELVESGKSVDACRTIILEKLAERTPATRADRYFIEDDEADKFSRAATDGLALRAGLAVEKPAPGASDFRGMRLMRLAEICLRMGGHTNIRRMSDSDIARAALKVRDIPGTSTGSLPNLLKSTAERTLRAAYTNWPVTWRTWAKATQASDFRDINRVALTGAPELDKIPEGGEYKNFMLGENTQSYAISKYGKKFSITWEALVNDDLDALTRVPRMFGAASARLVNAIVYGLLFTNGAMYDGTALFHADHGNLGTGGAPSATTMKEARKMMRTQEDEDENPMNVVPFYGLFPAALEHDVYVLLNSVSYTEKNSADTENFEGPNPYRNIVTPVIDPTLDGNSETAWYLVANHQQIDTVEVAFLEGRQEPEVTEIENVDIDGRSWKARICFGAAAIDWRGLFKNAGA